MNMIFTRVVEFLRRFTTRQSAHLLERELLRHVRSRSPLRDRPYRLRTVSDRKGEVATIMNGCCQFVVFAVPNEACKRWTDREVLKNFAEEYAPPTDMREAIILARRWTRLPPDGKPDIETMYKAVGASSWIDPGFPEWLTKSLGADMYYGFKAEFPEEAIEYRRQILAICRGTTEFLGQIGGGGEALACSLARHVQELRKHILGKDAAL